MRWPGEENCWCNVKNVDNPEFHGPGCEAVREILGIKEDT